MATAAGNAPNERPLKIPIVRLTYHLNDLWGRLFNNDRLRFQYILWGFFLSHRWRGEKRFSGLAHNRFRAIGGDR